MTNYENIKNMTIAEMANDFLIFIPNNTDFHYSGLSGQYFMTAEETISDNVVWLLQEAEHLSFSELIKQENIKERQPLPEPPKSEDVYEVFKHQKY